MKNRDVHEVLVDVCQHPKSRLCAVWMSEAERFDRFLAPGANLGSKWVIYVAGRKCLVMDRPPVGLPVHSLPPIIEGDAA